MKRTWVFFLLLVFVAPVMGLTTKEIEPGTSPETIKKIHWLDRFGTVVWLQKPTRRGPFFACQQGDHVLLRRPWGLEYTWVNQDVVACPDFF